MSPQGSCVHTHEADPSKGGIQGVLAGQEQCGNSSVPCTCSSLLPKHRRTALCPLAFAHLPIGVLPPPVGQHKVCVTEDGREAQGLGHLPVGDSEISGQDLSGTKHRGDGDVVRLWEGACLQAAARQRGHVPAAATGKRLWEKLYGSSISSQTQGAGEPALPCLYLHGALLALLPDVAHGDEAEHQVCQVQLLTSLEVLGAQLRHLPGKPLGARSRASNAKAPVAEGLPHAGYPS